MIIRRFSLTRGSTALIFGTLLLFTIYLLLRGSETLPWVVKRGQKDNLAISCNCHKEYVSVKAHPCLIDSTFNSTLPQNSTALKLGPLVNLKYPDTPEFFFRQNNLFRPSQCPTSLHKKVEEVQWFADIFRPDFQMLLNASLMREDEFIRLMPYYMPFGYKSNARNFTYSELMEILEMIPHADSLFDFQGKPRPKCISCAIVGTGGILNGSHMGPEIDQHDMVFRVNNLARKGHEDDVGTKITHYIMFDRSLMLTKPEDYPKDKGIIYIFVPCRIQDFSYLKDMMMDPAKLRKKPRLSANPENVRLLHPDFVRYMHKIWENVRSFRPTTGGIMLMTALHSGCDRLSIYGMGMTKYYTYHFYDKEWSKGVPVLGSHDHRREIKIMQDLHRDGIAFFYKRAAKDLV